MSDEPRQYECLECTVCCGIGSLAVLMSAQTGDGRFAVQEGVYGCGDDPEWP
jgi:hypothetical protein